MKTQEIIRHEEMFGVGTMNPKVRGFLPVPTSYLKTHGDMLDVILPNRGSKKSAGYDFVSPINVEIKPNEKVLIWTDVCAYMKDDEVLDLHVRSSVGIKKDLMLANTTGIIDADYYANEKNFGNIGICLRNIGNETVYIKQSERIAQGVFKKYLVTDNDQAEGERTGGIGSTGE